MSELAQAARWVAYLLSAALLAALPGLMLGSHQPASAVAVALVLATLGCLAVCLITTVAGTRPQPHRLRATSPAARGLTPRLETDLPHIPACPRAPGDV